ncbi:MAG: polyphosphate polymerase domain-containing protein [Planctomycetes bacterium]|nr:polyphosphate polymerase domain-containing protein [Planctomycetota bacterium]
MNDTFQRHELKIVLTPDAAQRVRLWAADYMTPDPFAGSDDTYMVHSLYCDNAALDVYHRMAEDGGTKYRVRRYGNEDVVWLERKRRKGTLVSKRRAPVPLARLPDLLLQPSSTGFVGQFQEALQQGGYSPRLLVSYARAAWVGEGGIRLTMDGALSAGIPVRASAQAQTPIATAALTTNGANYFDAPKRSASVSAAIILELKYNAEQPPLFSDLLHRLGKSGESFSKYAHSVVATGLGLDAGSDVSAAPGRSEP